MNLEQKIMQDIKASMLAKDSLKLEVCRSIKSAIILAKSEKGFDKITKEKEIEILQKLYKQRKESYAIYVNQKRLDLAEHEDSQAKIISTYLPAPYTLNELEELINAIMQELDLFSKKDMGILMKTIVHRVQGRADGKTISTILSDKLN
tara:strand:+ start:104 stop:550 length:447 start_codon:yes stop_codon:yes gene_type:complete